MKNIMIGCAIAAMAAAPAFAQGQGKGQGNGHVKSTPSAGATTMRGSADVLPSTSASARGVERGSMSSTRATPTTPTVRSAKSAATNTLRSGALIKDSKGATVGRVDRVIAATSTTPATVVVRMGDRLVTVPQTTLNTTGDFIVYNAVKSTFR